MQLCHATQVQTQDLGGQQIALGEGVEPDAANLRGRLRMQLIEGDRDRPLRSQYRQRGLDDAVRRLDASSVGKAKDLGAIGGEIQRRPVALHRRRDP